MDDPDREMRKLFVDRLTSSISENDLHAVFSQFGEIEEIARFKDKRSASRFYAFVVYKTEQSCLIASRHAEIVIKGVRCTSILAAIGKKFSGSRCLILPDFFGSIDTLFLRLRLASATGKSFFVAEGLLDEESGRGQRGRKGRGRGRKSKGNAGRNAKNRRRNQGQKQKQENVMKTREER